VAGDGASFSADLPKGEVISFESTGVAVGIEGTDTACANEGFDGLEGRGRGPLPVRVDVDAKAARAHSLRLARQGGTEPSVRSVASSVGACDGPAVRAAPRTDLLQPPGRSGLGAA
jgi:hypothetical protein